MQAQLGGHSLVVECGRAEEGEEWFDKAVVWIKATLEPPPFCILLDNEGSVAAGSLPFDVSRPCVQEGWEGIGREARFDLWMLVVLFVA